MDAELPSGARIGVDAAIARLATRQHGAVSRAQLHEIGLGRGAIEHRVNSGRLHRVHRGVYLVGHGAVTHGARVMAAVLACGSGAIASHMSAAELWVLTRTRQRRAVDVTVVGTWAGSKQGVRVHRVRHLERRDRRVLDGIPVTSPARTLFDLAAVLPASETEQAVAEAEARRLVRDRDLVDVLARNPGCRGAAAFRALVGEGAALTRSEAERKLLSLVRDAELPRPEPNVRLGRYEVDFLWRDQRLIVEVDGYRFHGGRAAFERDRRRDAELQAHGFRVIRVTWRQLASEGRAVVARLGSALEALPPTSRG